MSSGIRRVTPRGWLGPYSFIDVRDILPSHFPLFLGGPHARHPEMPGPQNLDGCRNTLDKDIEWPVSKAHSLLQL